MEESNRFDELEKKYKAEVSDTIEHTQINYWEKIRHPFSGGIELTPYCNLRCVHCYLQDSEKIELLSTEQIKKIIDKLYDKGVLFLYFTGGEIFTRKDFAEIYTYTKKKGFIVELLTNATLIDEKIIEVFNKYPPARVSISMYGKDEETYRKVTRSEGSFEKFIKGINLLKENDINFEIKFIALKQNIQDFFAVEEFAKSVGAEFSFTFEIFQTLCGNGEVVDNMLDIKDIIEFEKNYERTRRIWSVNISDENKYSKLPEDEIPLYMCNIGTSSFLIDYKGYINPCNKMRIEKFNLLECEFDEAWEDFKKYKQIKAPKNYKCATCKNISICNPCPAQNLMSTGKYDKPRDVICKLTSARVNEFKKAEYDSYREELQEYKNKNQIIKSS